ncbi:hypothetical protein LCL96_09940 [Rossellomorea aquimaris]|uniref:hypothetical protein n=1 Tax=Rossellomorea TaxID=2837508 RepID=UPI001CD2B1FF|nr:hypothetical protein [Rossellomorea aquimaris]MCA1059260.1 hypothetical protein [Rossellomorea aquimaris]
MLLYDDVKKLFPDAKGIYLPGYTFLVVSNSTSMRMEKGLYVPFGDKIDLFKSIEMGAIASLWPNSEQVPSFVPNHFPLFMVEDVYLAYVDLQENYKQNYNQEKWEIMTKFIYINEPEKHQTVENGSAMKQKREKGGE